MLKLPSFVLAGLLALSANILAQGTNITDLKVRVFSGAGWFRHPDIPKINRWLVGKWPNG